jgi:hypothetical protein
MTPEEMNQARLNCASARVSWPSSGGEEVHGAGMPENVSTGTLAEECMHLCSYFVVRGLGWNLKTFLRRPARLHDIHRTPLRKEQQRKAELN